MKVQFNQFFLGNSSEQCSGDWVEVNGKRCDISDFSPKAPYTSVYRGRIQSLCSEDVKKKFEHLGLRLLHLLCVADFVAGSRRAR